MSIPFAPRPGLLRQATIDSYDSITKQAVIIFDANVSSASTNKLTPKTKITIPLSIGYNNGLFIGAKPVKGTPIIVGQGEGNSYYFVSFNLQGSSYTRLPDLKEDELAISSTKLACIKLNTDDKIKIGSNDSNVSYYTGNKFLETFSSSMFDQEFSFSQAGYSVNGLIKREYERNDDYHDSNKLFDDDYYINQATTVCLDPSSSLSVLNNSKKNPPFVEKREVVYEYAYTSKVERDSVEQLCYNDNIDKKQPGKSDTIDRRNSRANLLSLSLSDPNTLMEEVKGTVVDTFGNIIDINRNKLKLGNDNGLTFNEAKDKKKAFLDLKKEARKSLAYHFEINAKKDLDKLSSTEPTSDYIKTKSKFFLDIDKEGLFKLNIPATSESGNIPLLTRYDNYSRFKKDNEQLEDTDNPNKLYFREDGLDILQESFAKGAMSIKNGTIEDSPIDKNSKEHIKYGTAYHNLNNLCLAHQSNDYLGYQIIEAITLNPSVSETSVVNEIRPIKNFVSTEIVIGENAGGRSGSISMDGSLDFNIGANTVDRNSLTIDLAGGMIAAIGKDKRGVSSAIHMDGHLCMQIGNKPVVDDSRFSKDATYTGGALDIRVISSGGKATLLRIDDQGVKIMTPGRLEIVSSKDMNIISAAKIHIEGEEVVIQNRLHQKEFGGSS